MNIERSRHHPARNLCYRRSKSKVYLHAGCDNNRTRLFKLLLQKAVQKSTRLNCVRYLLNHSARNKYNTEPAQVFNYNCANSTRYRANWQAQNFKYLLNQNLSGKNKNKTLHQCRRLYWKHTCDQDELRINTECQMSSIQTRSAQLSHQKLKVSRDWSNRNLLLRLCYRTRLIDPQRAKESGLFGMMTRR